jgi:hypothetical protein
MVSEAGGAIPHQPSPKGNGAKQNKSNNQGTPYFGAGAKIDFTGPGLVKVRTSTSQM